MFKNLASALILTERDAEDDDNAPKVKGRIVTTLAKAKEIRPLVEKCITLAGKALDHLDAAKEHETIVFSWVEWPDKAARDAGMARMMEDPRMDPKTNPMPFDGMRMIFGGFQAVIDLR